MRRIGEASFSLDKLVGSKESKLDESINENERRRIFQGTQRPYGVCRVQVFL